MKKYLYLTLVLATALGVSQAATVNSDQQNGSDSSVSDDTRTPSALNPQTESPDSINRMNPNSGQNPDSQLNPNARPELVGTSSSQNSAKQDKNYQQQPTDATGTSAATTESVSTDNGEVPAQ